MFSTGNIDYSSKMYYILIDIGKGYSSEIKRRRNCVAMEKLTDPRVLRSRASIEFAFLQLLESKSCEKISVKEILDLSGYSRSAFYANYVTKQGLIDSLLENLSSEIAAGLQQVAQSENAALVRRQDVLHLFEYIYDQRAIFNGLILPRDEYRLDCLSQTIRLLSDLETERDKTKNTDYKLLRYYMLIGGLFSVVEWWKQNTYKFSPQYVAELFLNVIKSNDTDGIAK